MPPTYHHHNSTRHSVRASSNWNSTSPSIGTSSSSLSLPSSSTGSATTSKGKRKSTPYKSPTAIKRSGSVSGGEKERVINVSQLLRVLSKEHASNQLDSQRYPTASSSSSSSTKGGSPGKEGGKRVYKRDVLIPMDTHYGRGKRSASTTPSTTNTNTIRGRSPRINSSLAPPPSALTNSTMIRSLSQLSVPPSPRSHVQSSMNRSTSLGPASATPSSFSVPSTPAPPVPLPSSSSSTTTTSSSSITSPSLLAASAESTLVVINSPLARSFTSNGKGEIEEKLTVEGRRSRNPSSSTSTNSLVSPRASPRSQPATTSTSVTSNNPLMGYGSVTA
ncbi:hypothetical protein JCM5350_006478 [Sporobolomyces pararoseus]